MSQKFYLSDLLKKNFTLIHLTIPFFQTQFYYRWRQSFLEEHLQFL